MPREMRDRIKRILVPFAACISMFYVCVCVSFFILPEVVLQITWWFSPLAFVVVATALCIHMFRKSQNKLPSRDEEARTLILALGMVATLLVAFVGRVLSRIHWNPNSPIL